MESTNKIKSYPKGGRSGEKCLQGNNDNSDNNKGAQIFRISFEFLQGNAHFFFVFKECVLPNELFVSALEQKTQFTV